MYRKFPSLARRSKLTPPVASGSNTCRWAYFLVGAVLILLTWHPNSPEGCGMWQSHTPAGTWHPTESHILGSVSPGHTGCLPAEPPRYRSDTGSGPVRLCIGPPSPPGCIPGNLSTTEEESRIYNDDSLEPRSLVNCIILNNGFFGTGTNESPTLLLLPNQINPKPKWSTLLKLTSLYTLNLFLPSFKYLLLS